MLFSWRKGTIVNQQNLNLCEMFGDYYGLE